MNQSPEPPHLETNSRTGHWIVLVLILLVCLIIAFARDLRVSFTFELNRKSPAAPTDGPELPKIDLPPVPPFPSFERIPPPSIEESEVSETIQCRINDTDRPTVSPRTILYSSGVNQGPPWKR